MATSTEKTVRDVIVGAIQGIASTLGFDDTNGNVRAYLPQFHQSEELSSYFMARVGGKEVARVWAVQVVANDHFYTTTSDRFIRNYRITVRAYYHPGINGEGVNTMIDHARKVREAIKDLTTNLSATVDLVNSVSEFEPTTLPVSGIDVDRLLLGEFVIEAERARPDF